MTTAATHHEQSTTTEATLCVAFDLSEKTWKLGFTTGLRSTPSYRLRYTSILPEGTH